MVCVMVFLLNDEYKQFIQHSVARQGWDCIRKDRRQDAGATRIIYNRSGWPADRLNLPYTDTRHEWQALP